MKLVLKKLRRLRPSVGLSLLITAVVPLAIPAKATTVAAAGDIACDPTDANFSGNQLNSCQHRATAGLIASDGTINKVLALGDQQYEQGSLDQYRASYDPSWGVFKSMTEPVPGNRDYATPNAQGYFDYFGSAAHRDAGGYYSLNVGSWHLVALNSNCSSMSGTTDGCAVGSPQEAWLKKDLKADTHKCTLAFDHHPRYSSTGSTSSIAPLVQDLFDDGAEVLLSGHQHNYERFAPQTPGGQRDDAKGFVQFVVGTGGRNFHKFGSAIRQNSLVHNASSFGILKLTLNSNNYKWKFVSTDGKFSDSGSASCH